MDSAPCLAPYPGRPEPDHCTLCNAPHAKEEATVSELSDRISRLQAVSTALTRAVTAAQVAAVIVGQGVAAVGARCGVLVQLDESASCLEIVHGQGFAEEVLRGWNPIPLNSAIPLADAARTGSPIWIHCIRERDARFPIFRTLNLGSNPSGAIVPLKVGNRVIGAISFGFAVPHPFHESERTFLLAWAEQGAQALERARLYDAARHEIEQRRQAQRYSEVLADLGRRLSETHTPLEAARIIVEAANLLLGWDACSFDLFDESANDIVALLVMDTLDGKRQEVSPLNLRCTPDTINYRVLHQGAHMILRDPNSPDSPSEVHLPPFGDTSRRSASLMYVPIRHAEQVIGVLSIQSYTFHAYDKRALAMLQALADHCGGALERMRAEEGLRASEQRFRALAGSSGNGIWQITPDGMTLYVNPLMCAMLEIDSPDELAQVTFDSFFERDGLERLRREQTRPSNSATFHCEVELVGRLQSRRQLLASVARLHTPEGGVESCLITFTDITERNRNQKIIEWQAYHDALTGLPNRSLFFDRLEQLITARRHTGQIAVLFLDLDRFKDVNDTLGHAVGDRLLKVVAERFARCIRTEDTIARMGGDEFTVLLSGLHVPGEAFKVARKLENTLEEPIRIDTHALFVTVSIGISLYPTDGRDAQTLLKHADMAMYRNKNHQK